MTFLAAQLWPVLALSLLLGFLFDLLGGPGRDSLSSRRWTKALAVGALAVGALLSASRSVPGRPGLWLDLAVPVFGSYALGCAAASLVRAVRNRRRASGTVAGS